MNSLIFGSRIDGTLCLGTFWRETSVITEIRAHLVQTNQLDDITQKRDFGEIRWARVVRGLMRALNLRSQDRYPS